MQWRLALAVVLALGGGGAHGQSATEQAQEAARGLTAAVVALDSAKSSRDQVTALTETIQAYEHGLLALRQGLRQVAIREATLRRQFEAKRDRVAQLIGVLSSLDVDAGPMLLLHPSGPVGTARSAMMLAEVTPALQAEAEVLRGELQELGMIRLLQTAAGETLSEGLRAAQEARTALSQAVSDRTTLPRRFVEDPEALRLLLESAQTLDAFAAGLVPGDGIDGAIRSFAAAKGALPMPVLGTLLRGYDEADAAGIRRPGLLLATRPRALVTAPWPATVRYRGPLLDYGNVMILEPGGGYLLVLAGLDTVYGEVGEVVAAGAPVGLMGGQESGVAEFLVAAQEGGGTEATETLYMELRQGAEPVDPTEWFAETRE